MCHLAKFHQNRINGFVDISIFDLQDDRRLPSWILNFLKIFLVDHQIGRPNVHRRTKFHKNWSNSC